MTGRPALARPPRICPCDTGRPYADCCGRYHASLDEHAPDALALMRSRYAAYVLDLRDYLLRTWHPRTRPARIDPPPDGLNWLGLAIKASGRIDEAQTFVEFVARSRLAGRGHRLHERSRFLFEAGQWLYVDGEMAPAKPKDVAAGR